MAIFLSHVDSSACPWDFSTVEQVGMLLLEVSVHTDTTRSRLTSQVLQGKYA